MVAGDPKAAPRFLAYMFGCEVANSANFYEVDSAGAAQLGVSARLPEYKKIQVARYLIFARFTSFCPVTLAR